MEMCFSLGKRIFCVATFDALLKLNPFKQNMLLTQNQSKAQNVNISLVLKAIMCRPNSPIAP